MLLIDLIGQRFGNLVVNGLYHKKNSSGTDEIFWTCVCDCRGETGGPGKKDVRGFSLRSGETTSCGCVRLATVRRPRKEDITGKVFGKLTVDGYVRSERSRRKKLFCRCICSCQDKTVTLVDRSKLISGETSSCGCVNTERVYLPRYVAGLRRVIGTYKKSARDRGIEWNLSDSEAESLLNLPCHYCGEMPKPRVIRDIKNRTEYTLGGIDRVDNSKGYTSTNTVPCCSRCNYAKRNYSYGDFMQMVISIYNHRCKEFDVPETVL